MCIRDRINQLQRDLGPNDRERLERYLQNVRELERRIQMIEAQNSTGEERELPSAPAGIPDSFEEHVQLMFDLQALAFASDTTRVFSFKMGRDSHRTRLIRHLSWHIVFAIALTCAAQLPQLGATQNQKTTSEPSRANENHI